MDVDRVFMHTEAKDADPAKKLAYLRQVGAAGSAFEHAVPERLFADPAKPLDDPTQPQGISAVKALAIAAGQGQRIYTLNQQNQAYHAGIVAGLGTDADTKAEIANALNAGMEVTVHQADITAHGWTGSGYIVLDPETGAGAYKISGGANGGLLILLQELASAINIVLNLLIPSAHASSGGGEDGGWLVFLASIVPIVKATLGAIIEAVSALVAIVVQFIQYATACHNAEAVYLLTYMYAAITISVSILGFFAGLPFAIGVLVSAAIDITIGFALMPALRLCALDYLFKKGNIA
jgi:hypothetical protein